MTSSTKTTFIPKKNRDRLIKDIVEIMKKPLTEHGIYYFHDENNMMQGHAIIFGPKTTIYENGIFLFRFKFPANYPYEPPVLKYLTNDGNTRFNPNLYRSSKVCLSILNTWRGEQWTACQTISTVLLTLTTLFHNKPLLNEPGLTEKHRDFDKYNKILEYQNFKVAINGIYSKKYLPADFEKFFDTIENHIKKEKKNIINKIIYLSNTYKKKETLHTSIYNMSVCIDYDGLLEETNELFKLN